MTEQGGPIISAEFAAAFAANWIADWNAHDLDRIMAHYAEAFEMRSPGIVAVAGEASGVLRGKGAVRAYWGKALRANPALRFELAGVYAGIGSVAIHYRNVGRFPAVEVFEFDGDGLVARSSALRGKLE